MTSDRPTLAQLARAALRACDERGEIARIPHHDHRLALAIRLSTGLNEYQFADVLGVPPDRVRALENGSARTDRHENQLLDLARRRAAEKGPDARVYFLRLHRQAERQGPAMAAVLLLLGVETS